MATTCAPGRAHLRGSPKSQWLSERPRHRLSRKLDPRDLSLLDAILASGHAQREDSARRRGPAAGVIRTSQRAGGAGGGKEAAGGGEGRGVQLRARAALEEGLPGAAAPRGGDGGGPRSRPHAPSCVRLRVDRLSPMLSPSLSHMLSLSLMLSLSCSFSPSLSIYRSVCLSGYLPTCTSVGLSTRLSETRLPY